MSNLIADFLEEAWFYGNRSRNSSREDLSSQIQDKRDLESPFSTLHVSASAPEFSNLHRRGTVPAPALAAAPPKPQRSRHVRRAASADERDPDNGNQMTVRPSSARPPRPNAPGRASVRTNTAQQRSTVFSERSKAWRARLEAVTAGSRLYSVPVPAKPATRAPSVQSTPPGSPRTDDAPSPGSHTSSYSNLGQAAAYSHAVPTVWVGHAADQAPQDFSQLSHAELMLFLQQAGVSSITLVQDSAEQDHAALVAAAQAAKGSWEVERICVGCGFEAPEDILRVPRRSDISVLKQAWKKLAMHVHPDKCSAEGAAIAMAIAKDAYEMLTLRAEAAALAKELNSNGASAELRNTPGDASGPNTSVDGASGAKKTSAATQTSPSGPSLSSATTATDAEQQKKASAVPPLPTKVRVKVKAVNKKNEMNQ